METIYRMFWSLISGLDNNILFFHMQIFWLVIKTFVVVETKITFYMLLTIRHPRVCYQIMMKLTSTGVSPKQKQTDARQNFLSLY